MVSCRNVWKTFHRSGGNKLLRQHLAEMVTGRKATEGFHALRDVSFDLPSGAGLALIGSNGAGKSTLLAILSGLANPSRGSVEVHGRTAALLELGSGFHPDLTGRENVFLNAALLGLTQEKAKACFEEIVDFSGVRDFIDEPLRHYSSGMIVRLAFSVAVNVDPEILIIDEVIAVGDKEFAAKSLNRVLELRKRGKTFICVSHSPSLLKDLCDRAVWLEHGQIKMQGGIDEVLEAYQS